MKLEDLEIYNLSMDLSDKIWDIVMAWDYFSKDTIGKQWTRSSDSVSANIGEGFGRNSYRDARSFYYITRGSLYESKTWLEKAKRRSLISFELYDDILSTHNTLGIKLNRFINVQTKLIEKK
ncbi:four helix bundle protein [Paludibacter sp. 221]|uniref:four helix bundle protein n=1 Tax=Paludibacter sp. 221 TaxID=2302939 RepID=UPI0013D46E09|nr:four helix bundle protein [Paludibacter sp. 221]NDV47104.1 four helix bundle protein [Paludibacter sp. 221]